MKKFKKIINSMLAVTALTPITVAISACSNSTVAVRKFSFLNDYNDTAKAQIGAANYTVSANDFVVGQENKITITFDKYSAIAKVTSKKQYFEIYQTNSFGRTPGELVEGIDYTVENPSTHVFVIKFTAEQSKKVTKDMTVRFKAYYKTVKNIKVELPTSDKLCGTLEDYWTYNNYVNYDYSFLAIPRHLECGYDVSDAVIAKAKVYGVKSDGSSEQITTAKFEKVLAYFKMQNIGDVVPSQSHYMRVTIPMNSLFTIDDKENFTPKYTSIRINGEVGCSAHKGTVFGNKFVLNPKNCEITERKYQWFDEWTFHDTKEKGVCYMAKFKATNGKTFNFDYEGKKKLPISSLRVQSRNELFKPIIIESADLVDDYFITDKAKFEYFMNYLDVIPKLENWLEFEVSEDKTELTVRVIIDKMCKYTQMPTESTIINEKLADYVGGSVDFLDYLSMDIVAE